MKLMWLYMILLLSASCATIRQNIDARTYLAKCQYELKDLVVKGVRLSEASELQTIDLQASVKVTNPTDREVALDRASFALFLDRHFVLETAHQSFVRIAPGASTTETIPISLPLGGLAEVVGHRPETLLVHAKLWMTLLIGKSTWETPIVFTAEVETPIPWDQINGLVAQEREKAIAKARAQSEAQLRAKAAEGVEMLNKALPPPAAPQLPSIPHF